MDSVLRTPDVRFANLPGFRCAPHYLEDITGYSGLRAHYVDEGPAGARRFPALVPDRPDAAGAALSRKSGATISCAGRLNISLPELVSEIFARTVA